jgi:hypothetical protein
MGILAIFRRLTLSPAGRKMFHRKSPYWQARRADMLNRRTSCTAKLEPAAARPVMVNVTD